MLQKLIQRRASIILAVIAAIIFMVSKDFALFWDTIQFAGKHPTYFTEHGLSLFLPEDMDSGHIPLFGWYITIVWKILGRSLFASHLAILPFVYCCFHAAFTLGKHWTASEPAAWLFPIGLLCMPQFLSQAVLVSPDIVLLAVFLMLLLSYIKKPISTSERISMSFFAVLLVCISNRGVILLGCIALWIYLRDKDRMKAIMSLLPAFIVVIMFHLGHFMQLGWVGFHDGMPWSESFELETKSSDGLSQLIRNSGIYIWRLMDYGMVAVWMSLLIVIYSEHRIGRKASSAYTIFKKQKAEYLILLLILIVVFGVIMIPFKGLMQHRYLLPIYVLSVFVLLIRTHLLEVEKWIKNVAIGSILVFIFCGNFWIYPDRIAQGWDSTLAHIPHYQMQQKAMDYLEEEGISLSEVGTAFPYRSVIDMIYLNGDSRRLSEKDLSNQSYILYSNIMNDFSDGEIDQLQEKWHIKQHWDKRGIKLILYQKRESIE